MKRGRIHSIKLGFPNYFFLLLLFTLCRASAKQDRIWLDFIISENVAAETNVGKILEEPNFTSQYSQKDLINTTFTFLRADDPQKEHFKIFPLTGVIQTVDKIDREELCPQVTTECVVRFDAVAKPVPVSFLEIIGIRITIMDLNDNEPVFPKEKIKFSVSESVAPGVSFILPPASDPDSGNFGIQNYDIISASNKFGLSVTNTVDGTPDLRLVLLESLDHEKKDRYELKVVARDGGHPPLYGNLDVDVEVVDVNDNSPKFDNNSYEVYVTEGTSRGSTILVVHATDQDRGRNGRVSYTFSPDTIERYGDLFVLNEESGEIYLHGVLNFEDESTYRLLVTARDQGGDAVPTAARVVVHVVDVNDHAPRVAVNALTPTGRVEVPENASPGKFVAHISVEDDDNGQNGETSCFLNDNRFQLQKIYHNEYKMMTGVRSFDRERDATFRVTLTCTDKGDPPLRSEQNIVGKVSDVNDNSPIFSQGSYVASLKENNVLDIVLLVVNASDRDEGANAQITYTILDDIHSKVSLNPNTGVIRATSKFDYERQHNFQFRIGAQDRGDPSRSSTATVIVHVIDINDEPPVFYRDQYNFAILEKQPPGSTVGTVAASDADVAPYNVIVYSLMGASEARFPFEIEPHSGKITTSRILDREEKASYNLVVVARNPGYPDLQASAKVTITVNDLNDNPPKINFPSPRNNTIELSCLRPSREPAIRLHATDPDAGRNGKVEFSIARGNEQGVFNIDPIKGGIMITPAIFNRYTNVYDLMIVVKDHGTPSLTSVTQLHVIINDTVTCPDNGAYYSDSVLSTTRRNRVILLSIAGTTVFLVLILVSAIIALRRKDTERNGRKNYSYSCPISLCASSGSRRRQADVDIQMSDKTERVGSLYSFEGEDESKYREVRYDMPSGDQSATVISNNWKTADNVQNGRKHTIDVRNQQGAMHGVKYMSGTVNFINEDSNQIIAPSPRSPTGPSQSKTKPTNRHKQTSHEPNSTASSTASSVSTVVESNAIGPRSTANGRVPDVKHTTPSGAERDWRFSEKTLEVQQLLQMDHKRTLRDADSLSVNSNDADSGRGTSEDGDPNHASKSAKHPPPPYDSMFERTGTPAAGTMVPLKIQSTNLNNSTPTSHHRTVAKSSESGSTFGNHVTPAIIGSPITYRDKTPLVAASPSPEIKSRTLGPHHRGQRLASTSLQSNSTDGLANLTGPDVLTKTRDHQSSENGLRYFCTEPRKYRKPPQPVHPADPRISGQSMPMRILGSIQESRDTRSNVDRTCNYS